MRLPGMHTAHLFQSTPLSLAETLFIFGGTMTAQISIHSAIASGDEIITLLFGVSKISIHSAIASGDVDYDALVMQGLQFQSTPLSLAETAISHILYHKTSNNHGQFAHISLNHFSQSSHFPSITVKFSVRTSQGFYDHFWFAP